MSEIVYGVVRCCRDWPIVYFFQDVIWPWRTCGLCGERPTLVSVEESR